EIVWVTKTLTQPEYLCYTLYSGPDAIGAGERFCGEQEFMSPMAVMSVEIEGEISAHTNLVLNEGSGGVSDDPFDPANWDWETVGTPIDMTLAPEGVAQNEYDRLNDAEKALCRASPLNCYGYYSNANAALTWADSMA